MIKAIIFDLGNVLFRFDDDIIFEKFSAVSDKSSQEIAAIILGDDGPKMRLESGKISTSQYIEESIRRCNLSISKEEFAKIFPDRFTPIETTLEIIRKLSGKFKLAALSDTNELDYRYLYENYNETKLLDPAVLSYEVGVMKPNKAIFLEALKRLELKPEECVYIDDIRRHTDAAGELGIHGIQYISHEKLISDLEGLGVEW